MTVLTAAARAPVLPTVIMVTQAQAGRWPRRAPWLAVPHRR